jgi:transposase
LDLGDRNSWYCVVDEAGQILWSNESVPMRKPCRKSWAPCRSRIALEIGTHSPWVSRLLSELGHEVIVANARKVRLIGESNRETLLSGKSWDVCPKWHTSRTDTNR